MNYQELYNESNQYPEKFWAEQANQIEWHKKPSTILSILFIKFNIKLVG